MKTLQEHLKESFDKNIKNKYGGDLDFKAAEMGNGYNWIYEAMKAYAQEACREQREICAQAYEHSSTFVNQYNSVTKNDVKNAPEPTMI